MNRLSKPLCSAVVAALGLFIGNAHASDLVIIVGTEIFDADLSSPVPAPFPLASDPANALGDSIDGWGFVDTHVRVTESATETSSGKTSLSIPTECLLGLCTIEIKSEFTFNFDLELTDVDDRPGRDFYAGSLDPGSPVSDSIGLGSPLLLLASDATPLEVTVTSMQEIDALDLFNIVITDLGTDVVSGQVVHHLGTDINQNGENDTLKYSAASFAFDIDDLSFDIIDFGPVDLTPWLLGIGDVEIIADGSLSVSSASVTFSGSVQDESTDPPFSIGLIGTINRPTSVPEPFSLILMCTGLLALVACQRGRGRA